MFKLRVSSTGSENLWSFIGRLRNIEVLSCKSHLGSYVVLDGGTSNPLSEICKRAGIPYLDYVVSSSSVNLSCRFLYNSFRYSLKFGISTGRLIAFLVSMEAKGVLTLEKTDQRNALRAVSFALPQIQIIIVQHSRFFESPHLHNTWGNPRNVRLVTWGEAHIVMSELQGRLRSLAIPMGSVRLALDREIQPSIQRTVPLLVAMKAKGLNPNGTVDGSERGLRAKSNLYLLEFLGRYAQEHGISLGFLSDERESLEVAESYLHTFRSTSGASCHYEYPLKFDLEVPHQGTNSSYSTIRRARVLVGVNSSILWEAVADAQPVVPVSFGNTIYNQFPKIGDWVLRNPTYRQLEEAIEAATEANQEELIERSKRFSEYLVSPFVSSASLTLIEFLRCARSSIELEEAEVKWLRSRSNNVPIVD